MRFSEASTLFTSIVSYCVGFDAGSRSCTDAADNFFFGIDALTPLDDFSPVLGLETPMHCDPSPSCLAHLAEMARNQPGYAAFMPSGDLPDFGSNWSLGDH